MLKELERTEFIDLLVTYGYSTEQAELDATLSETLGSSVVLNLDNDETLKIKVKK